MAEPTCSVYHCLRSPFRRGWCTTHYTRWQRFGDPHMEYPTLAELLWVNIRRRPTGCWEWVGSLNSDGYGRLRAGNRDGHRWLAHRLAYHLLVEPIPDGLMVRHKCDNPPCCNPSHLELGTNADNMRDRNERDRCCRLYGEARWNASLTDDDVRTVRRMLGQGFTQDEVAATVGTSQATVSAIKLGKRWAHVTG